MPEAGSRAPGEFPAEDWVLDLAEIDQAQFAVVGGKGAHLGELARIGGADVPPGCCVTTHAFRLVLEQVPSIRDRIDRLSRLDPDDREPIRALSVEVRRGIEGVGVPDEVAATIARRLAPFEEGTAFAVRSSATAEDSPAASFAGQHDTYLNVVGPAAVLEHVSRCWASLFTERAVTYRLRGGFGLREAGMAVVVQRMVDPEVAGVLFTADPVTSNRGIVTVEAAFGLGEALVSGLGGADVHQVRDGAVETTPAAKRFAIRAAPGGGTRREEVPRELQERAALTEEQVLRLARLGRRVEAHFGRPQDIEWCLEGDALRIVQSRPITALFPVPAAADREHRVYVSVGHQQMMTDAMKPLGISVWLLTSPAPMVEAGGRLFVDVTRRLTSPASRDDLLKALGDSDPLIEDALRALLDRGFVTSSTDERPGGPSAGDVPEPIDTDPGVVTELVQRSRESLAAVQRDIAAKSGSDLFDFILDDLQELRRLMFDPRSHQVLMAAVDAATWLDEQLRTWLGEDGAADVLTRSVPDNIASQMGLALLDVADAIRPHPDVVAFLRAAEHADPAHEDFLAELPAVEGGRRAQDAIRGYLDEYGMRCVGEIDITRPRWSERPIGLVPAILRNVENFETGAGERLFERGRRQARTKERELLRRVRSLPDGQRRAEEVQRAVERLRTFAGYREYPKHHMVSRYSAYKRALLAEAERQVRAGVLAEAEDIYYLTFQEFHDVVRTGQLDEELIRRRAAEFREHQALRPPRVLTSEGEVVPGEYRRLGVPEGALVGLAVSTGVAEGRARVVADMAEADLEPGDVLVTTGTDPSWSPVLATIGGLVTEVGGRTTHGAVVAREYGLPAVVGVQRATRRIRDGQRIRVHGTSGYVEVLD